MKYLCLIYTDEARQQNMSEDQRQAMIQKYFAFDVAVKEAGVHVGSNPLQSVTTATTVRVRDGKTSTMDGPFAETKEQLGGYYLLDCKDLDEALAWAAKIPTAEWGSIEVRPVMTID